MPRARSLATSAVDYSRTFPLGLIPRLYGHAGDCEPSAEQTAAFERFAFVGDPLADDLVAAMKAPGGSRLRRQFEVALADGIAAVPDAPEELRAFFAFSEQVPFWVDQAKLERAAELIAGLGPIAGPMLMVGLSVTYTTPDGNAVLLRSGDTRDKAGKRATETLAWVADVTERGGLARGAAGYQGSLRVRLVHAFMRSGMMKRGDWDNPHLAVNQQVYSNVIVAFAVYPTLAALAVGKVYSRRDREAIFHLWRYVAHLVGVHPDLIPADQHDMMRLLTFFLRMVIQPDESATTLGTALVDAYPGIYGLDGDGRADAIARWLVLHVHTGLARVTLGRVLSDLLGYPKVSPAAVPLLVSGAAAYGLTTLLDVVPPVRRARCRAMGTLQRRLLDRMMASTGAAMVATMESKHESAPAQGVVA